MFCHPGRNSFCTEILRFDSGQKTENAECSNQLKSLSASHMLSVVPPDERDCISLSPSKCGKDRVEGTLETAQTGITAALM